MARAQGNSDFSNALTLAWLTVEAQTVIGIRALGMAGVLPRAANENRRMIDEKVSALLTSQTAMWVSAASLKPPADVLAAGLAPYRKATYANSRRLTRAAGKAFRIF